MGGPRNSCSSRFRKSHLSDQLAILSPLTQPTHLQWLPKKSSRGLPANGSSPASSDDGAPDQHLSALPIPLSPQFSPPAQSTNYKSKSSHFHIASKLLRFWNEE
ncbi:hypothetical protein PoB_004524600 [Plakobranchus ocellatus]|uniref:Uncharacterized protein n=1 Tax=Plakobranchus ocellatus TaxID=259542 RepID=A0AAV4BE97_9GAST|nr:hypothetical protein PoB_004524600 [Plakobranchus ocellatus]